MGGFLAGFPVFKGVLRAFIHGGQLSLPPVLYDLHQLQSNYQYPWVTWVSFISSSDYSVLMVPWCRCQPRGFVASTKNIVFPWRRKEAVKIYSWKASHACITFSCGECAFMCLLCPVSPCHYYCTLETLTYCSSVILFPVTLFALLHTVTFTKKLLDVSQKINFSFHVIHVLLFMYCKLGLLIWISPEKLWNALFQILGSGGILNMSLVRLVIFFSCNNFGVRHFL